MGHEGIRLAQEEERIVELEAAITHDHRSLFDQAIGVGEDCLSPRQFVRLLREGASDEDLSHLLGCLTCLENVSRLTAVNMEVDPDFVRRALAKAAGGHAKPSVPATKASGTLPIVVGLKTRIFPVIDPKSNNLTFSCALIPGFERSQLAEINLRSLRVDGAIIATACRIDDRVDVNNDGTADYLKITFEGAKLAPRVRDSITQHQRVIDTVRLYGRFEGQKTGGFLGQARLEIVD